MQTDGDMMDVDGQMVGKGMDRQTDRQTDRHDGDSYHIHLYQN